MEPWDSMVKRWEKSAMTDQEAIDFLIEWAKDKDETVWVPLVAHFENVQRQNKTLVQQVSDLERKVANLEWLLNKVSK